MRERKRGRKRVTVGVSRRVSMSAQLHASSQVHIIHECLDVSLTNTNTSGTERKLRLYKYTYINIYISAVFQQNPTKTVMEMRFQSCQNAYARHTYIVPKTKSNLKCDFAFLEWPCDSSRVTSPHCLS